MLHGSELSLNWPGGDIGVELNRWSIPFVIDEGFVVFVYRGKKMINCYCFLYFLLRFCPSSINGVSKGMIGMSLLTSFIIFPMLLMDYF